MIDLFHVHPASVTSRGHVSGTLTKKGNPFAAADEGGLEMADVRDQEKTGSEAQPASEQAMSDCVFCRYAYGHEERAMIYADAEIVAFQDIRPVSTHHYLVIPRAHIPHAGHLEREHHGLGASREREHDCFGASGDSLA